MKRLLIICLVLFMAVSLGVVPLLGNAEVARAESPPAIDWLDQFGSSAYDWACSVAVDGSGNVYLAGFTDGALPGQSSAGGADAFVRKYNSSGSEQWTRQFGTASAEHAFGISVDSTGVYVVGQTDGALPGQSSAGGTDAFVCKYDTSGTLQWTRQFGTTLDDYIHGVFADSSGVYVAGHTYATLPGQSSAGNYDAFLRKYDANGSEQWTRQFGTALNDYSRGVSVDFTGVYVAGYTNGTFPGESSAGGYDAFVRKYDANGSEVWTSQFGTTSIDYALGIFIDSTGVYVAGLAKGTLPGQSSAGNYDAFLRKYDAGGTELWTRQFGTNSYDYAYSVSANSDGVYVTGYTGGTLPGQSSAGGRDAYVRKYDAGGSEVWTCQFGTASTEHAFGISASSKGVYFVGQTDGTLVGQSSAGGYDAYIVKFQMGAKYCIIIGIVAVAVIVVVFLLVYFLWWRRRSV